MFPRQPYDDGVPEVDEPRIQSARRPVQETRGAQIRPETPRGQVRDNFYIFFISKAAQINL